MVAAGRFLLAAEKLLAAIGVESAIAGGVAVNVYGFARGTRDVDIITALPLEKVRERLKRHGIESVLHKGDLLEGDFPCLKGVVGVSSRGSKGHSGVPFDVLPQLVPMEMTELDVQGHRLRVVDLETLIRLKLKAGSVKDLHDIAILVHLHPDLGPRAEALAGHDADVSGRLATLIRDPGTLGQAREIRRQEEALRRFEKRRAGRPSRKR
jgi:hypothetical protein